MRTFKKILKILVLVHIFPLIGILASKGGFLEKYLMGWICNLIVFGALTVIVFGWWLFEDEDGDKDDYEYYY